LQFVCSVWYQTLSHHGEFIWHQIYELEWSSSSKSLFHLPTWYERVKRRTIIRNKWIMGHGRIHDFIHNCGIYTLCFNHDTLITGGTDGAILIWNLITGERIKKMPLHYDEVRAVSLCENFVISGSFDRCIYLSNF